MQILHLHDSPHITGGATRYLRQLLQEMEARGHRSALFSVDHAGQDLCEPAVAFVYERPRSALRRRIDFHHGHRPLADALRAFLERVDPDLVHVQNWGVFRSTVFPVLAAAGRPVAMTVHDFTLLDPNPFGLDRSGPLGPLRHWLDERSLLGDRRRVFDAVDRFLCPSEALRRAIPFPRGTAALLRLPLALEEAPPLPPLPVRLFFAGTLFRSKGVDLLLEALTEVPEVELEIAGSGDREGALRRQAEATCLARRVHFLGTLSRPEMQAAYGRSHLLVLPSRVPENSPLTILEAGALGRPALAAGAGGVPELVAAPERGWLFPPGDVAALAAQLREILARPEEIARRGARMRAWVGEHCDSETHWDALEGHWRELVG